MERIIRLECLFCGFIDKYGINGVDRIDSHIREYRKDNVVPCCPRCNLTKRVLSVDIFVKRMYHYTFHHFHSSTIPSKEFQEAFESPNRLCRKYDHITSDAKRDGYKCHFKREQFEKALNGWLCNQCHVNPSTSIIRYQRDRGLSPENFTRVCTCCGSMF